MSQFTRLQKHLIQIEKTDSENTYRNAFVANEHIDEIRRKLTTLEHAIFVNFGTKDSEFAEVSFRYTRFYSCYFRNCTFVKCNFTGCEFVDCKFPGSTFDGCKFEYSRWKSTEISAENILPEVRNIQWDNVRRDVLRSLRINAKELGQGKVARLYLLEEKAAERRFLWDAFKPKRASYYRSKYSGWSRAEKAFEWAGAFLDKWVWGYGESPFHLFVSGLVVLMFYALVFLCKAPDVFGYDGSFDSAITALWEAILLSASGLSSGIIASALESVPSSLEFWLVLESLTGLILTGVVAAVVYRWISARAGH